MECIKSINSSSYKDKELIIIDDNSADATKALTGARVKKAAKNFSAVRIVHNSQNLKMVKSRNLGARLARNKYVLFIDDDNVIGRDMIRVLVEFADANTAYGIIGPSMYYGNGRLYMNYQTINFYTGKTRGTALKNPEKDHYDTAGVPNVFMIRNEVFGKSGYFDEQLVQTFTEPDFSLKAAKYGFKSCMLPAAKTIHKVQEEDNFTPRGLGGQFRQKAYCLMRNRTLIIARYGAWHQKLIYGIFFSWFWPLVYSALMLKFMRFDLMKLYWTGFKDGIVYLLTGKLKNSLEELLK